MRELDEVRLARDESVRFAPPTVLGWDVGQ